MIWEVSCIQYRPFAARSKEEAERIAILRVCRSLRKRGYQGGIFQYRLVHRESGHIHVATSAEEGDEGFMCLCCREVQRPIRSHGKIREFKVCNCGDCVACDSVIRMDMEQLTRD